MHEGTKINRSLLALANCINALRENKKGVYVNFRDSKLTRLLKDSLGGKNKTVMIVTISPSNSQFEETLNTLKYANRAKEIQIQPVINREQNLEFEAKQQKHLMRDLEKDIENLKSELHTAAKNQQSGKSAQQTPV